MWCQKCASFLTALSSSLRPHQAGASSLPVRATRKLFTVESELRQGVTGLDILLTAGIPRERVSEAMMDGETDPAAVKRRLELLNYLFLEVRVPRVSPLLFHRVIIRSVSLPPGATGRV
jgi:hypothetical protein